MSKKTNKKVNETPDEKPVVTRNFNTVESLAKVLASLDAVYNDVEALASPNFIKSMRKNLDATHKKITNEIVLARKRDMKKLVNKALSEGKEIIIQG